MTFPNILGWIGAILFLGSYYLVSANKIKADSISFHMYNFLGALGVTVDTFSQEVWSAVALNFLWGIIALYHLIKLVGKVKPELQKI